MKYKIIIYLFVLAIIGACKPEIEEFKTSNGAANFTRFASLGFALPFESLGRAVISAVLTVIFVPMSSVAVVIRSVISRSSENLS